MIILFWLIGFVNLLCTLSDDYTLYSEILNYLLTYLIGIIIMFNIKDVQYKIIGAFTCLTSIISMSVGLWNISFLLLYCFFIIGLIIFHFKPNFKITF